MQTLRWFAIAAIAASVLTACSGEGNDPRPNTAGPDGIPMRFFTTLEGETGSRALTLKPLEEEETSFGVWTRKHMADGSVQAVMQTIDGKPYLTEYISGNWVYELTGQYLKYWDLSAVSYDFAAFAPYSENSGVTLTDEGKIHIDVAAHTSTTPRWLVAQWQRDASPLLDTDCIDGITYPLNMMTAHVPLVFHRIMSRIQFTIANNKDETVYVEKVTVTLVNEDGSESKYIITGATYEGGTWLTPATATDDRLLYQTDFKVNGPDNPVEFPATIEIPQPLTGLYVKIDIETENNSVSTILPLGDPDWKVGHTYIYNIRFDDTGDEQIILVNVTVPDWEYGGEIEGGTQTNW